MAARSHDPLRHCRQIEAAFAHLPLGLIAFDEDSRVVLVNQRFGEIYRLPPGAVQRGMTLREVLRKRKAAGSLDEDPDKRHQELRRMRQAGAREIEYDLTFDKGRYIHVRSHPLPGGGWVSTHDDITDQHNAEVDRDRSLEFLRSVMDSVPASIWLKDAQGRFLLVNRVYEQTFGHDREAVHGKTAHEFLSPEIAGRLEMQDSEAWASAKPVEVEVTRDYDDERGRRHLVVNRETVRSGAGDEYLVGIIEDITERKKKDEQIVHMANYDMLTGLPNRMQFRARLDQALLDLRPGEAIQLLYLDLDHFKTANDSLGHGVGDELLVAVAQRLRQCLREVDIVSRLGGDEFAIILMPGDGEPVDAAAASERILEHLREPFDLKHHRLSIDASIGIAGAPIDGTELEELLQNADLALYQAKGEGRGIYRHYKPDMRSRVVVRQSLEQDLRAAVRDRQFVVHYQPIFDLRRDRIASVEALIRWQHPVRGLVLPDEFIQVAEETRLIVPIGEWVLEQACHDAAALPGDIRLAVNFSQAQFAERNLVSRIAQIAGDHGIRPDRLELEITESHLVRDRQAAYRRIVRLHEMGFHIAIDDFGTNYSSLHQLASYPFDKIKIDKTFIGRASESGTNRRITELIISLGAALGMTVTAEGVETEEQLQLLRKLGCGEVQGFVVSRPEPIAKIAAIAASVEQRISRAV